MDTRTHDEIIKLGKVLAEEQHRDCDNTTTEGGLGQFVEHWRQRADGALSVPNVRDALALLAGYDMQPPHVRQEGLARALELLRDIFRQQNAASGKQPTPTTTPKPTPTPAAPPKPASRSTKKTSRKPALTDVPLDDPAIALNTSLNRIPDIGRNIASAFKRIGVKTIEDLLYHFPHRYDDYSTNKCIADLTIGETETVVGSVTDVRSFPLKRKNTMGIDVQLSDQTGSLKVVFFGNQWLYRQFEIGRAIVVSGKVEVRQGLRQMTRPDWEPYTEDELLHTGRLVPVHPLTRGLHERNARQVIKHVVDSVAPILNDYLPDIVRERVNLLSLSEAIAQIHFPDTPEMLQRARTRLAFDEFLFIQLGVVQRKILWQSELGCQLAFHEAVHDDLLSHLPFALTGAQQRALGELFADMQRPVPMARLLQGDVGSGKTVVAAAALVQAIANGLQGALMAPTEILAEQHYHGLKKVLARVRVPRAGQPATPVTPASNGDDGDDGHNGHDGHDGHDGQNDERAKRLQEIKNILGMTPEDDMGGEGIRVALLTGSLGKKDRRRVLEAIEKGDVDLVVGTHALITESVQYHDLGMVCVDEQHRFGVEQRQRLKKKGFNPHMLVMTATPIPRTLTLTIYGELDTSVLDELPPGRQVIKTRWIRRSERDKAYKHIRSQVEQGRQAFVICPLVEESEKVDLPSAEEMYTILQERIYPDLRVGIIHGRLLPREKDVVMRAFRDHEYDILVATAVVEVGIDVPNATTIMIDGAERFGLAQLHQFRGRVGRGEHQSFCILVSDMENEITTQRLEAMENTHDGFELAEIDLRLRGPGEFFGRRQSGTPDLKVAQLADTRLLKTARLEAEKILADDPRLELAEHVLLREKVRLFWEKAEGAS